MVVVLMVSGLQGISRKPDIERILKKELGQFCGVLKEIEILFLEF